MHLSKDIETLHFQSGHRWVDINSSSSLTASQPSLCLAGVLHSRSSTARRPAPARVCWHCCHDRSFVTISHPVRPVFAPGSLVLICVSVPPQSGLPPNLQSRAFAPQTICTAIPLHHFWSQGRYFELPCSAESQYASGSFPSPNEISDPKYLFTL